MNKRSFPILFIFFFSLIITACSSAPGEVEVSCDDFYDVQERSGEITVAVDEEFTLTLCSNPTTGFLWSEDADISDDEVIQQISHEFVLPEEKDEPPPPGTPGQEIWTFKGLKAGSSTIYVEYSRPWEGGEKGEWTFILMVIVE